MLDVSEYDKICEFRKKLKDKKDVSIKIKEKKIRELLFAAYELYEKDPNIKNKDLTLDLLKEHKEVVNNVCNQPIEGNYFRKQAILKQKRKILDSIYGNALLDYKIAKKSGATKEQLIEKKKLMKKAKNKLLKSNLIKLSKVLITITCIGGSAVSTFILPTMIGGIVLAPISAAIKAGIKTAANTAKTVANDCNASLLGALSESQKVLNNSAQVIVNQAAKVVA